MCLFLALFPRPYVCERDSRILRPYPPDRHDAALRLVVVIYVGLLDRFNELDKILHFRGQLSMLERALFGRYKSRESVEVPESGWVYGGCGVRG